MKEAIQAKTKMIRTDSYETVEKAQDTDSTPERAVSSKIRIHASKRRKARLTEAKQNDPNS